MPYEPRSYRRQMNRKGLTYFPVVYRETDLSIGVDVGSFSLGLPGKVLQQIKLLRHSLDKYIEIQPEFLQSLSPVTLLPFAPPLAQVMAAASFSGDVGPMASVAGAFAQSVGEFLRSDLGVREVIVENGGDLYLDTSSEASVGIFAGKSPLSGQLALRITPDRMPLGICTSAGTIGPSLSLGNTDATITLSRSAALADAFATTLGNLVKEPADVKKALAIAPTLPGLLGCVLIIGDKLGAWGDVELKPL